ncbi:MAG: hypothetical protein ACLP2U_11090 [Syntrophobacteraceae bacterium]
MVPDQAGWKKERFSWSAGTLIDLYEFVLFIELIGIIGVEIATFDRKLVQCPTIN